MTVDSLIVSSHALFQGLDYLLCCDNGGKLIVQVRQGMEMHFPGTNRHAVEVSIERCCGIANEQNLESEISRHACRRFTAMVRGQTDDHHRGNVQVTQTFLEISSDEGWIDILM